MSLAQSSDTSELSRVRNLFHRSLKTKSVRHQAVSVLLLSWRDTDIDVRQEIDELSTVFEESYGFATCKKTLDSRKPTQQLNLTLAQFTYEHDDDNTLLIVYYAGHGVEVPGHNNDLKLVGRVTAPSEPDHNEVAWRAAEILLVGTKADVFVIFDCCYAGLLCQNRSANRFEYLGACSANETTRTPGPNSFTTALIWALRELRATEQSFSTSVLQQRIKQAPNFPPYQFPPLAQRLLLGEESPDHIMISPRNLENRSDLYSTIDSTKPCIDVRLHFNRQRLTDHDVKQAAKQLGRLLDVNLGDITLIQKLDSVTEKEAQLRTKYGKRWLSLARRRKWPANLYSGGCQSQMCLTPEYSPYLHECRSDSDIENDGILALLQDSNADLQFGNVCEDVSAKLDLARLSPPSTFSETCSRAPSEESGTPKDVEVPVNQYVYTRRGSTQQGISNITGATADKAKKDQGGSTHSQKRPRENDNTDDEDGDLEGRKPPSSRAKLDRADVEPKRKFACPFYKYDPQTCTHRSCAGPGWDLLHRVKEHVIRVHRQHQCRRCGQCFDSSNNLKEHHRQTELNCPKTDIEPALGVDSEQEKTIRKRKRVNDNSVEAEEKRWYELYRVVFPESRRLVDDELPSPYYDCSLQADQTKHLLEMMIEDQTEVVTLLADACFQSLRDSFGQSNLRARLEETIKAILHQCFGKALSRVRDQHNHMTTEPESELSRDTHTNEEPRAVSEATFAHITPSNSDVQATPINEPSNRRETNVDAQATNTQVDVPVPQFNHGAPANVTGFSGSNSHIASPTHETPATHQVLSSSPLRSTGLASSQPQLSLFDVQSTMSPLSLHNTQRPTWITEGAAPAHRGPPQQTQQITGPNMFGSQSYVPGTFNSSGQPGQVPQLPPNSQWYWSPSSYYDFPNNYNQQNGSQ